MSQYVIDTCAASSAAAAGVVVMRGSTQYLAPCLVAQKIRRSKRRGGDARAVQCGAVCCSVLQCVAMCCSVMYHKTQPGGVDEVWGGYDCRLLKITGLFCRISSLL